jgi:hypothetical protein
MCFISIWRTDHENCIDRGSIHRRNVFVWRHDGAGSGAAIQNRDGLRARAGQLPG